MTPKIRVYGLRGFLVTLGNRSGRVRFLPNTVNTVYRWEYTIENQPCGRCICMGDCVVKVLEVLRNDERYRKVLNKPPRDNARGWILREA